MPTPTKITDMEMYNFIIQFKKLMDRIEKIEKARNALDMDRYNTNGHEFISRADQFIERLHRLIWEFQDEFLEVEKSIRSPN